MVKSCFCTCLETLQFSQGFAAGCWSSRQLAEQGNLPTSFSSPSFLSQAAGKEQGPTLAFTAGKSETLSKKPYPSLHLKAQESPPQALYQVFCGENKLSEHSGDLGRCLHFLQNNRLPSQGREGMGLWHTEREEKVGRKSTWWSYFWVGEFRCQEAARMVGWGSDNNVIACTRWHSTLRQEEHVGCIFFQLKDALSVFVFKQ